MDFSVRRSPPDAIVSLRAQGDEWRKQIRGIVLEGARRGAMAARARAPRGKDGATQRGRRIVDAIRYDQRTPVAVPGGAGGGSQWQSRFWVDENIAPQIKFVWNGTRAIITARGNIGQRGEFTHRGVLKIQKEGEPIHYRNWVRGQKPQREWWYAAQRTADDYVKRTLREIQIPEK